MNASEKTNLLTTITGVQDKKIISAYLRIAESEIMGRAYPYGGSPETVPPEYEMTQIQAAAYLINKMGAEGETSHSEGGISRSYESGGIPESIMRNILPHARSICREVFDLADDAT